MALKACGVSYVDVLLVAGQYQVKRPLPFIPGSEAAGIVVQTGTDVSTVQPGDRVLVPAGFAEEAVVAAEHVTTLPDTVSFETAAAFRSNYTTAYYALQRGRLKAGEILLVHGAAGGVGLATVDMGKLFGATVIATASSEEKLAVCKQQGADHVINYTHGFREQIKELTGDRGVDVIFDPVGGDVFDESMRCAELVAISTGIFPVISRGLSGYKTTLHCRASCTPKIIFSLKHYWRFVDCEALELKALSQGVDGKVA